MHLPIEKPEIEPRARPASGFSKGVPVLKRFGSTFCFAQVGQIENWSYISLTIGTEERKEFTHIGWQMNIFRIKHGREWNIGVLERWGE